MFAFCSTGKWCKCNLRLQRLFATGASQCDAIQVIEALLLRVWSFPCRTCCDEPLLTHGYEMKRSNHGFTAAPLIVLMTVDGVSHAQSLNQPSDAADPPVREVLTKFIDAINSQDLGQIRTYVERNFEVDQTDQDSWPTHCCAPNEVAQTLLNVGRRSGGLSRDSAIPHGSGITAFLTAKSSGKKLYIDLECRSKEPYFIKSYQIVVMSPTPEEFLPTVKTALPLTTTRAMAERALDEAASRQSFSGTVLIADHGEIILRGRTARRTEFAISQTS